MNTRILILVCSLLLASCFPAPALHADMSSAAYKIAGESVSGGGGGRMASASNAVEEGRIDSLTKEAMAGTNFKVEGEVGTSHALDAPVIETVTPADFSRFFSDGEASYALKAKDSKGGSLEYQLKVDGIVKNPWQASSTIAYLLASGDRGRHRLDFEVRNSEAATSMSQSQYVFRRPR